MMRISALTALQKRAVFKIAVDLIKADNRIHYKEISVLEHIQDSLNLSQDELDLIHYMTLDEAVNALRDLERDTALELIELFSGIMKADSDISFDENILLTSVVMSIADSSKEWVCVITGTKTDIKVSDDQIVFLEKEYSPETHKVLDDKYDSLLISKAFTDVGLQLFYLPSVLGDLGVRTGDDRSPSGRFGLLQKSMGYLMPSGNKNKIENIESIMDSFDTTMFFKVVMTGLNISPDRFPFSSFLMIKIRDSVLLDDYNNSRDVVDFLCIDISTEVKKRILEFVSYFNDRSFLLPYEGYYKLLYDHLSSAAKITSSVLIDENMNFLMENLGNTKVTFESSPQSRTFYLLLLYYGRAGLGQDVINQAVDFLKNTDACSMCPDQPFNIDIVKQRLAEMNTEWSRLICNTITIYQSVSTKDEQKSGYLSYICSILNHRSSLKTYINRGFSEVGSLASPDQYYVRFDKESNSYYVDISSSLFYCFQSGSRIEFPMSSLWDSLL